MSCDIGREAASAAFKRPTGVDGRLRVVQPNLDEVYLIVFADLMGCALRTPGPRNARHMDPINQTFPSGPNPMQLWLMLVN